MRYNAFDLTKVVRLAVIATLVAVGGYSMREARITRASAIDITTAIDSLELDGKCSLREAIRAANLDIAIDACAAGSGPDTINLPPGTYTLSLEGRGEDIADTGDLDITADLIVIGAISSTTILDANALDRVFETFPGANVTIANVTIRNGDPGLDNGGGIRNVGSLTLANSIVISNTVSEFAGGGIQSSGTLTVTNSLISNNTANVGGGIDNEGHLAVIGGTISDNIGGGITNAGTVSVDSSRIQDNSSDSSGGGIANFSGHLIVSNSTIISNTAELGGGLRNSGTMTVTKSIISHNIGEIGAGVASDSNGTTTLIDSILENNTGRGITNVGMLVVKSSTINGNAGNGIFNEISGTAIMTDTTVSSNAESGINNRGRLTLMNSAVISNTMFFDGAGLTNSGTLTMTNSTVSGNMASGNGGGIANTSGTASLNNVTITNNTANSTGDGAGDGGGIYNSVGGTFSLKNTIVASNTVGINGSPFPAHSDCLGLFDSLGYNLIGDQVSDRCRGFVAGINGDLVGNSATSGAIDPKLGALSHNGGATMTHALLPASPAIDAGNPAPVGSEADSCETTDQRGIVRPQGTRCDIGAFERAAGPASAPIFMPVVLHRRA